MYLKTEYFKAHTHEKDRRIAGLCRALFSGSDPALCQSHDTDTRLLSVISAYFTPARIYVGGR